MIRRCSEPVRLRAAVFVMAWLLALLVGEATSAAQSPAAGAEAEAVKTGGSGDAAGEAGEAKEKKAPARRSRALGFSLELSTADPVRRPAWQVEALAAVLPVDLAGDGLRRAVPRPVPAPVAASPEASGSAAPAPPTTNEASPSTNEASPPPDAAACAARGDCSVEEYRGAGVDLVIRAQLTAGALRYQLWWIDEAATELRLDGRGEIDLTAGPRAESVAQSLDRRELARELGDAVRDVRRRQSQQIAAEAQAPAAVSAPDRAILFEALGATAVLFALPLLLALALRVPAGRALRLRSQKVSAGVLASAGATVVVFAALGEAVTETPATVFLLGGLSWGLLVVVLVPAALPPVAGLSRVEHGELANVLSGWFSVAWRRCLLLGLIIFGLGWVGLLLAARAGLSQQITWGVAMPLAGLAVWHAVRAVVEVLAARLDALLVDGDASVEAPWHRAVAGYVRGYFRRADLADQEELFDDVLFLPGKHPGVRVYGGGLTESRIVVERALLEHALAPYDRPHDYAAPRVSTLHWMQWNSGLITPAEQGSAVASRGQRQPRELTVEGDTDHQPLGEPITLAGVVEPAQLDARPRYRPHDDTAWISWDHGEEHDGTDASDKDWLFGALVVALGAIHRGEDRGATLRQSWRTRGLKRAEAKAEAKAKEAEAARAEGALHHSPESFGETVIDRKSEVAQDASVEEHELVSRESMAAHVRASAQRAALSSSPVSVPVEAVAAAKAASSAVAVATSAVGKAEKPAEVLAGGLPSSVVSADEPPAEVAANVVSEGEPAEVATKVEQSSEVVAVGEGAEVAASAEQPVAAVEIAEVATKAEQPAAEVSRVEEAEVEVSAEQASAAATVGGTVEASVNEEQSSSDVDDEPRMVDGTREFAAVVPEEEEPRMVDGTREFAAVVPEEEEPRMVDGTREFAAVVPEEEEPRMVDGTKEFAAVVVPEEEEPRMVDGTREFAAVSIPEEEEPRMVDGTKEFAAVVVPEEEEPRMVDGTREFAAVVVPEEEEPRMVDGTREFAAVVVPEEEEPRMVDGTREFAAVVVPEEEEPRMVDGTKELAAVEPPPGVEVPASLLVDEIVVPMKRVASSFAVPAVAVEVTDEALATPPAPPVTPEAEKVARRPVRFPTSPTSQSSPTQSTRRRRPPRISVAPPLPPPKRGFAAGLARQILSLWDRGSIRLGDTQAALHAARHHVVQSIAFSLWRREELLTARGYQPELERATATVYQALAAERGKVNDPLLAARLRWLQPMVLRTHAAAHAGIKVRRRRGALVLAALAVVALLGFAVADAVKFHSLYESRLPAGAASSLDERAQDHGH